MLIKNNETKVYGQQNGLGLQPEPVRSDLLADFVKATQNKIIEVGVTSWNFSDIKLSLTSTAVPAVANNLNQVVKNIINDNGQVLSETYQTEGDGYGNYKVDIVATYTIGDGIEYPVKMNTFKSSFSEYQLTNGDWRLIGTLNYTKGDLDHTDKQFNSGIEIPNLGFLYFGEQIRDMFNNNLEHQKLILNYVNKITKLELTSVHVNKLITAIEDQNGNYQTGSDIDLFKKVDETYIYLSISSDEAEGVFNLLISTK